MPSLTPYDGYPNGNDDEDPYVTDPVGAILHAATSAEIDSELQAAIEYKIAMSGMAGVATVLKFLDEAVRRHLDV